MQPIEVTAAVIQQNGMTLICSRLKNKAESDRWEFPGGKCEPGENLAECLKREIREELGTEISVHEQIGENTVTVGEKRYHLNFIRASLIPGAPEPHPQEGQMMKWIPTVSLPDCNILPGDMVIAMKLAKEA